MTNRTWLSILPTLARIGALLCCLLTVGALLRMDVVKFPDHPVPVYVIRLLAPELTSQQVDESITLPVEAAVRSLGTAGSKIVSESRPGMATITVETSDLLDRDFREKLEQTLETSAAMLPVGEWSISQDNQADQRIGYFLLHGADVQTLADVARHTVYETLISLPGVARLEIEDDVVRQEVQLVFRPSALQAYGLTPGDVLAQLPPEAAAEEVGTVGRGKEQTSIQWHSQTEGPQALGSKMIASEKGYVPLKTLAEIRDLRGTKGEQIQVYQGEPAIGITVFAAQTGQLPAAREVVLETVDALNQAANGRYRMDLFADDAAPLTGAIGQISFLLGLAAVLCAAWIGWRQKSKLTALLSLLAVLLAAGALLGGMWLGGIPLSLSTIGPYSLFVLLGIGAGPFLFQRVSRQMEMTPLTCLRQSWGLIRPLLVTILVLTAGWFAVLVTDYVEPVDRSFLLAAWPIFLLGTITLLFVYGFVIPVLAASWGVKKPSPLTADAIPLAKRPTIRWAGYVRGRWEQTVRKGFLPYAVLLAVSLVTSMLLHPFLDVDSYETTAAEEKSLSLAMVRGSTVDDAIRAAQIAEQRLRGIPEVRDVYTVAEREGLTFHLLLHDIGKWTRTRYELEKELDRQLRDIRGTDPYAFVVNKEQKLRLEFTVRGPSRHMTEEIAQNVLTMLQEVRTRDEKGREMITDERIGDERSGTYLDIRPRQEMLLRYRVSEAEIKRQLASYLGNQPVGSVNWNGREVAVLARFPEGWMEHEDQVKNTMIRTPQGMARLRDLVDVSYGTQPTVYKREDGWYVMQVSSAVSDPGRIETLSYALPLQMKERMTMPEGYQVLNANEWEKLKEAEAIRADGSGRLLTIAGLAACIVVGSVLLQARTRDGWIAIALLPLTAGAVIVGLMATDRPMNLLGFYGIAAAIALMVQQALFHLDEIVQTNDEDTPLWQRVVRGSASAVCSLSGAFAAVAVTSLPFAAGWLGGGYTASYTSSLFFGILLGAYAAIVLVPGMHYAIELRHAQKAVITLPIVIEKLRVWWENEQVRRQDRRADRMKRASTAGKTQEKEAMSAAGKSIENLSSEDFLPIAATERDGAQH
ncbi:efflux RND transporter permease subunit [Brevibacillus sp. TJ4]|uniref:efflux RND transporter permease subunit n=1 Tax=Brevibacillus sp. TJ4 TaxID=3234853 RepID=UPI0037D2E01F